MNSHVKGFFAIIVLGLIVVLGIKFVIPIFKAEFQKDTSDARDLKGTITLALDNWVGYSILSSPEMKKRMRRSGYLLEIVNDDANYEERMKGLKKGDYQFAVATVDSYVTAGKHEDYPATIVAVIDESKGGDAILAWDDKVKSLDDLKRHSGYKVAYTPDSPSSYLLSGVGVHFDIPALIGGGDWRVETGGSEEALKSFLKKNVDVAVLWEPDVSRAIEKGNGKVVKLLGTEDTSKFIVDVLLVSRKFSEDNPEATKILLANYFRTLKYYKDNPDVHKEDLLSETSLKKDQIDTMLKGVAWANLEENNRLWFGVSSFGAIPEEGLVDTIEATIRILNDSGVESGNPLPGRDPYRLLNSRFISELHTEGLSAGQFGTANNNYVGQMGQGSQREFSVLDAKGWDALREVGTLKVRPIVFQSGRSVLSFEAKEELDNAAAALQHYPNFRVVIKGHTGTVGDKDANKRLSQERADAVKQYLTIAHDVEENRVRSVGYGSDKPLPRQPSESLRSYNYRLPRVELYLASEVY